MMRVVFQNLLINSAHAMHGKGKIRVAVERPTRRARSRSRTPGPAFRLTSATRSSRPSSPRRREGPASVCPPSSG